MPQRKVGPVGLFPTHSTTQNFPQNYTTSKFAYPGPANSANIQPAERVNGCTQYRFWVRNRKTSPTESKAWWHFKYFALRLCSWHCRYSSPPQLEQSVSNYVVDRSWLAIISIKIQLQNHLRSFPTCQVRVVRFYQSCSSPPPRLALLLLLLLLFLLLLFLLLLLRLFRLDHVCINFHLNFRLANSSPSSLPTSQLSVHRWTSTWDLPSSVCTAGPQPGTFPAQCALLDLNLGPSQLSVHRWTSTWDLTRCTAGPQPGTFPAQCAPLDLNLGPAQLSVHRWTSTAR